MKNKNKPKNVLSDKEILLEQEMLKIMREKGKFRSGKKTGKFTLGKIEMKALMSGIITGSALEAIIEKSSALSADVAKDVVSAMFVYADIDFTFTGATRVRIDGVDYQGPDTAYGVKLVKPYYTFELVVQSTVGWEFNTTRIQPVGAGQNRRLAQPQTGYNSDARYPETVI